MNSQDHGISGKLVDRLVVRLGFALALVGAAFLGYLGLISSLPVAARSALVTRVLLALAGSGVLVLAITWLVLSPVRRALDELAAGRRPDDALSRDAAKWAARVPLAGAFLVGVFWIVGSSAIRPTLATLGLSGAAVEAGSIAGICVGAISGLFYYYLAVSTLFVARLSLPGLGWTRARPVRSRVVISCVAVLVFGVSMVGVSAWLNHQTALESSSVASCERATQALSGLEVSSSALVEAASRACGGPAAITLGGRVLVPWGLEDPASLPAGRGPRGTLLRSQLRSGATLHVLVDSRAVPGAEGFTRQMLLFAAIALILAVGLAAVSSRAIVAPIRGLSAGAEALSRGDLTREITVLSGDELGSLAKSFHTMSGELRRMVSNVSSAANAVGEQVTLVAGAGERVRRGTETRGQAVLQATREMTAMDRSVAALGRDLSGLSGYVSSTGAALAQFAASLDEVRRHGAELERQVSESRGEIDTLAQAASSTRFEIFQLAKAARSTQSTVSDSLRTLEALGQAAKESELAATGLAEQTEAGSRVVEEGVRGVEAIRGVVAEARQRVQALEQRSADVTAVVDFIAEVAGRTNLLSLNAAIIAAQAGSQGKAFAVVADQVRDLASQIGSSTKRIADLIAGVRAEVDATRELIERSDVLAAAGVERAREGWQALSSITEATRGAGAVARSIGPAVSAHAEIAREIEQLAARVVEMVQGFAGTELLERGGESIESLAKSLSPLTQKVGSALEEQSAVSRKQVESLEEINRMIARLDRTIALHAEGTARALKGLNQLAELGGEDRTAADELSEAAEALTESAEALRQGLGQFRI